MKKYLLSFYFLLAVLVFANSSCSFLKDILTSNPEIPIPVVTPKPAKTPTPKPAVVTPTPTPVTKLTQITEGKIYFEVTGLENVPYDQSDTWVMTTFTWEQDVNNPDPNVPILTIYLRESGYLLRWSNCIGYDKKIFQTNPNAMQCGSGFNAHFGQPFEDGIWSVEFANELMIDGEKYGQIIVRSPVANESDEIKWKFNIDTYLGSAKGTLGFRWKIKDKGMFGIGNIVDGVPWTRKQNRDHLWNSPLLNTAVYNVKARIVKIINFAKKELIPCSQHL